MLLEIFLLSFLYKLFKIFASLYRWIFLFDKIILRKSVVQKILQISSLNKVFFISRFKRIYKNEIINGKEKFKGGGR